MLRGQVLGGFEIQEPIGAGGMGTVFRARQLSIDRLVAVKVIRDDAGTMRERFFREARLISAIDHQNIVQLVDFGHREDAGLVYYAMELIDGWPLSNLVRRGRMHPNLVIELMMQLCAALAEAHAHAVIHRDLKASNIQISVSADGSVRLRVLDFGIARSFADTANVTMDGVLCGTPSYMAPEQVRGHNLTPSADLYAAGICMYYMLVGELPFRGGTAMEIAVKQIQGDPPTLDDAVERGYVPRLLADLCVSLLCKDPRDRPGSAVAVRHALIEIRQQLGWGPLILHPPDLASFLNLINAKLSAERVPQPRSWQPPGTAGVGAPPDDADTQVQREDHPPVSREEPPPTSGRQGGGWDAFNSAAPALERPDAQALVLSPVTGEFMSVQPGEPEPPAAPPHAKPPSRPMARAPSVSYASADLDFERPARPTESRSPRSSSRFEMARFVLVGLVVLAISLFIVTKVMDGAPEPPVQRPVVEEPVAEDAPKVRRKSSPKAKKTVTKKKSDPIDVFADAPPDRDDKPPIIIEGGKP